MAKDTELKIYKKLYELSNSLVHQLWYAAYNTISLEEQFGPHTPEEKLKTFEEVLKRIGQRDRWDYNGIINKESQNMIKFLEYSLDDNQTKEK